MGRLTKWMVLVLAAAIAVGLALAGPPGVAATPVPDGYCCLSKEHIGIDSTYAGDTVSVSGRAEPGAYIVVKVSSPPASLKLSRKGRVGPIWMNVSEVEFDHAPAFYQINCTETLNPVLPPELMADLGLGYEGLKSGMAVTPPSEDTPANFKEFVGLKESQGLYHVQPRSVKVDPEGVFHTVFSWPTNAPPGPYTVTVYEIRDGKVIGQADSVVRLEKVGFTRWLADMARTNGALYGLLAVLSALGAGLVVGFLFKGAKGH
jgi:uncharacterized protein (TIGR02186 family)